MNNSVCYYLEWQGSPLDPPWELLEEDGINGRYCLIEKSRLPPKIECLRDPIYFSAFEAEQWLEHLRAGEEGELPDEHVFQFLQPRPGVFDVKLRTTKSPDARLTYGPESVAYALRQAKNTPRRDDELPTIFEDPPYLPIDEETEEAMLQSLQNSPLAELIPYLREYETAWPHQVCILQSPCGI